MSSRIRSAIYWVLAAFAISGCTVDVGSKTVGVHSGQFIYVDGNLKTEYRFPFDDVWTASEKALADMKAVNIGKKRYIANGTITGTIGNEKVTILVDYLAKEQTLTSVSVMVGPVGDSKASRLIHDKITAILLNKPGVK
jgi:hypothetical protein